MREYGVTPKELAAVANVNILTIYLSLWGIRRWKLTETVNICCFFRTADAERLFQKGSVRFRSVT
jgi:hypothetical protein